MSIDVVPPQLATGTIERWCLDLLEASDLQRKTRPGSPPDPEAETAWAAGFAAVRRPAPARPPELRVVARAPRSLGAGALHERSARARMVHTFAHHELQAAELFAWAILAFPDTPRAFRSGLLQLCLDELRHLGLYLDHLDALDSRFGAFAVRDWLWQRVAGCGDATSFVALLGLGLEGANLEHAARFAEGFRAAGDHAGAAILDRVQRDEIEHVAFARRWFPRLSGAPLDYDRWRAALPAPLTPSMLQGRPLNRTARRRAGLDDAFLDRLAAEPTTDTRSPR